LQAKQVSWLAALALVTVVGPLLGGGALIALAAAHPDLVTTGTSSWLVPIFAGIAGILAGIALLPSFLLAGFIGFATDGAVWGFALALLSLILATSVGMTLSRLLAPGAIEAILAAKPKWLQAYHDLQTKDGKSLLFAIFLARLSPQAPFALTNLMLGQLQVPIVHLTLSSWLGLVPRTIFSAAAGAGVNRLSSVADASSQVGTVEFILGGLALAAAFGSLLVRIWWKRKSSEVAQPAIDGDR
jgi:uncharacterized membrane protein YdjX (TVP38/TMEM64 family)